MKNDTFPTKFEKAEQSPGFLLWQVTCDWQRRQRKALASLDLTHVQFVLLTVLYWLEQTEGDGINQIRLAKQAHTDPMMTSQVLRKLEQNGWLKRIPDPKDQRAFLIKSTKQGRTLVKKALPIVEKVDEEFFSVLGKAGETKLTSLLCTLSEPESV